MTSQRHRPLRALLVLPALALVAALGLVVAPTSPVGPREVLAARPDLTITSTARYDVQPDDRRVRVTLDLTLTNHLKDTTTKRYYFDEAFLAVLPGTSGYKLTWEGDGSPSVKASKKTKTYTLLRLDLAERLYSGKTAKYRLTFNLKDPGGAATRDLRIGDSLVSFPVWAFATDDTPGSSVSVVFPDGYDVKVEAGSIPDPTVDDEGRTIFRSGELDAPLDFFAYLVADRPGAYTEQTIATTVADDPVRVTVRAWPDDPPWAERVSELLTTGLPALGEHVGLAWPHGDRLVVEEAVARTTGGYAGLFDPSEGKVEIAYYADDFVVLHEAAHGWFNGMLLADRWANEAFASYYAMEVAEDLAVEVRDTELTDELRAVRIPLNGWGPVGSEDPVQEDFAYAAGLELARAIAERAGDDGLRAVWADAAAGVQAYQPRAAGGTPETASGTPDWRGLLDLLEARTAATYDDLWRAWVARPTDLPLLDARAAAREQLSEVEAAVDGWRLPRPIRDAMRAWQFEDATDLLDGAAAALEQREAVESAAADAGLIAPDALRTAFEDDDGFDDALAEADAELAAIDAYADAAALRPAELSPILALGLWGLTPDIDLETARDALARGDLTGSVAASSSAATAWGEADGEGQGRAISLGLLAAAVVVGVLTVLLMFRRRRTRHRRAMAHRIQATD
jgi:hypothetical protein